MASWQKGTAGIRRETYLDRMLGVRLSEKVTFKLRSEGYAGTEMHRQQTIKYAKA